MYYILAISQLLLLLQKYFFKNMYQLQRPVPPKFSFPTFTMFLQDKCWRSLMMLKVNDMFLMILLRAVGQRPRQELLLRGHRRNDKSSKFIQEVQKHQGEDTVRKGKQAQYFNFWRIFSFFFHIITSAATPNQGSHFLMMEHHLVLPSAFYRLCGGAFFWLKYQGIF